ncbi:hypothetical protein Taro_031818, partial [Colocasia esculenta]|nr:hypothetical protein [Colocasia esculenta]
MASPSLSSSLSPPPLLPLHPLFFTIPEGEREEEDEAGTPEEGDSTCRRASVAAAADAYQRRPTPLHHATPSSASTTTRATPPKANVAREGDDHVVSCNKCRPSAREKISVVPLDGPKGRHGRSSSFSSPRNSGVLRSFFSSLTWKSPRLSSCSIASPAPTNPPSSQEEEWRLAATELSHKLIHATRKRDEALMEASRLKHSMAELEKKLTRLENYCHDLKSALDLCGQANPHRPTAPPMASPVRNRDFPLEPFLHAVSETRSAIRYLSRCLVAQIRQAGAPTKVQERILQLLQPYDVRLRGGGASSSLLFYLEALLSHSFFDDFESSAFQRGISDQVLDPRSRAQANLASYEALRGLSWEDVLSRGTRHYSEGFSRFCDLKMSEVAGTVLGGGLWGRSGAWPEPLLQAFFGAAKGVWLVHLLAWCDHPPVPVFRVDKGVPFDAGYMEDVAADRVRRLAPAAVRIMVAPGFYVRDSVVKCKVLCMYHKLHGGNGDNADKMGHGWAASPKGDYNILFAVTISRMAHEVNQEERRGCSRGNPATSALKNRVFKRTLFQAEKGGSQSKEREASSKRRRGRLCAALGVSGSWQPKKEPEEGEEESECSLYKGTVGKVFKKEREQGEREGPASHFFSSTLTDLYVMEEKKEGGGLSCAMSR